MPEAALSVLQMGVAVQKPCSVLRSRGSGCCSANAAAASPSSVMSGACNALNSAPNVSYVAPKKHIYVLGMLQLRSSMQTYGVTAIMKRNMGQSGSTCKLSGCTTRGARLEPPCPLTRRWAYVLMAPRVSLANTRMHALACKQHMNIQVIG